MSVYSGLTNNKLFVLTGTLVTAIIVYLFTCMGGSSSKNMNKPFVVAAQARHTATLIFLHGLGDTGQGWSEAFREMKLKNVKCVCPTAPIMPVTLNSGFRMPSWFDIRSLDPDGPEDEARIKEASKSLQELIAAEEKNGISSDNIFVGGFSQGGAVALYTAFSYEKPLAGIVGLSTWLPLHKEFPERLKANKNIPMFQAHGTRDPLVHLEWGERTAKYVKQMTDKHSFQTYEMMHTQCKEEMDEVKKFLNSLAKD